MTSGDSELEIPGRAGSKKGPTVAAPRMKIPASSEAWLQPLGGARVPLEGNCNLGRSPDNHIVIRSPKASRHHATIHAQDATEFWIVDLGSSNGTLHNGRRVLCPARLYDTDRISLAGAEFVFRQVTAVAPADLGNGSGTKTLIEFKQQPAWLLMADMESFTTMSRELAPEELSVAVGSWFQDCQALVEQRGGRVGKYLGDGFLAYWTAAEAMPERIAETVLGLQERRRTGKVCFRVVVHYGAVTFGGAAKLGEESMLGPDVNFVFRLEDLASSLGLIFCLSAPAHALLAPLLAAELVPGEHELKGFAGKHRLYSLISPGG